MTNPGASNHKRGGKAIPGAPDPPPAPPNFGQAYKRTVKSIVAPPSHMARSKTLTKTVAIEPEVHEKLLELQEAYKLRTVNDAIKRLISLLPAE